MVNNSLKELSKEQIQGYIMALEDDILIKKEQVQTYKQLLL